MTASLRLVGRLLLSFAATMILVDLSRAGEGFSFFEPIVPPRKLQSMAHRGAMTRAPENTAASIERSISDTVEWVEIDVRLTKDGRHVLLHDETLDGETNTSGKVSDFTLADLRSVDAGIKFAPRFKGEKILTLVEVLELVRGRVNLYLDCKEIDPALLAREIIAAKMEKQVIIYDDMQTLKAVKVAGSGTLPLMTKWRPQFGLDKGWAEDLQLAAVEIDAEHVTAEICESFHKRGIKVQAKTLGLKDDRPEVWTKMSDLGVDWVQTDRADEVVNQTVRRGLKKKYVQVAHHRGASQHAPENTLPALKHAILLNADFVEFDVHTTKDGGFVLVHDGTLNRTTTGRGPIREQNLEQIVNLDAGTWFGKPFIGTKVPTLDQFLEAAGKQVELYFDAKSIAPDALADSLRRHGVADRTVVFQGAAYLEKLREVAPEIRRMPPLGNPNDVDALVERVKPYAFDTKWTILSKELIDHCHAKGVKVFSDAIGRNETIDEYQRAIKDGIDLIQTDFPMRVLRAVELLDHEANKS